MIDYFKITDTVTEILSNEKITKEGLTLVYELENQNHIKLQEDLFYRNDPKGKDFKPTETFELEVGDIMVKFIKKK